MCPQTTCIKKEVAHRHLHHSGNMWNTHVYAKIPKECMCGANRPGDWASGASLIPGRTTTPQYCQKLPSAGSHSLQGWEEWRGDSVPLWTLLRENQASGEAFETEGPFPPTYIHLFTWGPSVCQAQCHSARTTDVTKQSLCLPDQVSIIVVGREAGMSR